MPEADSQPQALPAVLMSANSDGPLLVMPLEIAQAELATYAALVSAGTFADLDVDESAAQLVADWTPDYLERLAVELDLDQEHIDDDFTAQHAGQTSPFEADAFFGIDNWRVWIPDPQRSTAHWLEDQNHYDTFATQEGTWRLDELDTPAVVPVGRRAELTSRLRQDGWDVREVDNLEIAYRSGDLGDLQAKP